MIAVTAGEVWIRDKIEQDAEKRVRQVVEDDYAITEMVRKEQIRKLQETASNFNESFPNPPKNEFSPVAAPMQTGPAKQEKTGPIQVGPENQEAEPMQAGPAKQEKDEDEIVVRRIDTDNYAPEDKKWVDLALKGQAIQRETYKNLNLPLTKDALEVTFKRRGEIIIVPYKGTDVPDTAGPLTPQQQQRIFAAVTPPGLSMPVAKPASLST